MPLLQQRLLAEEYQLRRWRVRACPSWLPWRWQQRLLPAWRQQAWRQQAPWQAPCRLALHWAPQQCQWALLWRRAAMQRAWHPLAWWWPLRMAHQDPPAKPLLTR